MSDQGLFGRAVHGFRWLAVSRIVVQAVTWIFTLVVVRILRPSDYGLVSMAGLVTTFAQMLLDGGLGAAFVHRRCESDEVYKVANTVLMVAAVGVVLVVQALARPLANFFSAPMLDPVLRVYSVQFLLAALLLVPTAILTVHMRFKELASTQSISGIGMGLVTVGLALSGAGVWSLVVGALSGNLFKLLLRSWYAKPPRGVSTRISLLRPYTRFSVYLVGQRVLWFWAEQADEFIVARVLGAGLLGTYSVARNLAQIPLDKTGEIVNQVTLPSFAAVQDDMGRWLNGYAKFIRLVSAAGFPLFWGMAAVAPVALPLLLGAKWAATTIPFILLCLMLPFRLAHSLSSTALLSIGRSDVSFKAVVVWAVALTPLFLLGTRHGLLGVAVTWAIGFPLVYLCYIAIVARAVHVSVWRLLAPMAMPALAGALSAASAAATGWLLSGLLPPVAVLLLEVAVGVLAYVLTVRVASASLYAELADLIQLLMGRRPA